MKRAARYLLLATLVAFSSCSNHKHEGDKAFQDYTGRYLRAQHEYCSTNIAVAEQGLDTFREWLLDPRNPCEPIMNRHLALFKVNARMFLIEEFLGNTKLAEKQYNESVDEYNRYLEHLQSLHLPSQPHPLDAISSKEGLRELITLQDSGLDVGWMKSGANITPAGISPHF